MRLDFLKVLGIMQWYLFKRKNGSSSLFNFFFLLFRELYKSFYQVKWISCISSVGYWTVTNVTNNCNMKKLHNVSLIIGSVLINAKCKRIRTRWNTLHLCLLSSVFYVHYAFKNTKNMMVQAINNNINI